MSDLKIYLPLVTLNVLKLVG